ncbi:hypothetical protein CAEBREN_10895 [Caenorhabditis brenneri]|uniref:Uncharacterized protein n=1 Tax=Caenorhabditis brenneri TaxID=135651 RepID=G0MSR1_CAEBE|nr:hypothetical protein CAEBREN_10895 [Caenorhabditis brenneri]
MWAKFLVPLKSTQTHADTEKISDIRHISEKLRN